MKTTEEKKQEMINKINGMNRIAINIAHKKITEVHDFMHAYLNRSKNSAEAKRTARVVFGKGKDLTNILKDGRKKAKV